ncbi:MAG: response regulator [Alphaproteobacteria bacterium]|nr:response regulator [Alphaproteobacteria bacterium]MBU0859090.1 response regulator [Alphaproteobacteria bacterium]
MSAMQVEMSQVKKRDKAYDLSTFRVLIVEDFPFIASILSSSLSEMGVGKAMTAPDGVVGKERILNFNAVQSSQNIDVAIIDWFMPELPGLELLQWIRSHKSDTIKFLPVIICSAYASRELVEQSRDAGANEVIVKPVSAAKLAQRILHVIDNPRPYVRTAEFFGPDRRRKVEPQRGEDRRKTKPEDISETHERFE